MAHFFTRLADRSLGLSPVVQPAIAPRFGTALAEEDALDQPQLGDRQATAAHAVQPANAQPTPSLPAPVVPAQQMSSQLDPQPFSHGLAKDESPLQIPALPGASPSPLSSELRLPPPFTDRGMARELPRPDRDRGMDGGLPRLDAAEPFRVLGQPEPPPIAGHPWQSTALPSDETSIVAEGDVPRAARPPDSPSPAIGVMAVEGRDSPPERLGQRPPEPVSELYNRESLRLSASPASQAPLHATLPSQVVSPVAAEPPSSPPTIRVSIGRVEVRAMLPSPPATKATPVRARAAVSLNDYLKQRGGKP
jgi:hypothetical protein